MKIALFSDTFPPQINGVSNVVYRSSMSLARRGHDVLIFTVDRTSERKTDLPVPGRGSAQVIFLPSLPFWGYAGERVALPLGLAFHKIKKFQPDIIHTHTPFGVGIEAVIAAKLLKIPLVGTHHTFYDHYLKIVKLDYKWIKQIAWRYTVAYYNRCNTILSPSASLAAALKSYGVARPIQILPNSVDTEFFRPCSGVSAQQQLKNKLGVDGDLLVYVGRVSHEKSIDVVLRAVSEAVKVRPSIRLMIVGDGPATRELKELSRSLGLTDKTIFLGARRGNGVLEALQSADIFVTASASENMPISVLEAMAAGLPIIGVDALGVPEIVLNGRNGFVVPPDRPQLMAEKVLELLTDRSLRRNFAAASRQMSLDYSEEKITQSLENIYNRRYN